MHFIDLIMFLIDDLIKHYIFVLTKLNFELDTQIYYELNLQIIRNFVSYLPELNL